MKRATIQLAVWLAVGAAMWVAPASLRGQAPAQKPAQTQAQSPAQNGNQAPTGTEPKTRPRNVAASQGTVEASTQPVADGPVAPSEGTLVDQVVAVVNGELILESDVQEDKRFQAFQPFSPGAFNRDEAVERLIDRQLILQQAKLQPDDAVSRDEVLAQLQALRKDIPACKQYHCETDAGWQKFVQAQGFTMDELVSRWQQRMQVLKFIEIRFRSGIQISPAEIKTYYEQKLLPEYAARHATAPKLEVISDRIQEILLQQQVSSLLGDWLKSLKAQGTVRVMRPEEVQP